MHPSGIISAQLDGTFCGIDVSSLIVTLGDLIIPGCGSGLRSPTWFARDKRFCPTAYWAFLDTLRTSAEDAGLLGMTVANVYTVFLMNTLSVRITETNSLLAPYAVPVEGTLGRSIPEPGDATRFPFQRDRDRIIHTQAFRRLQGKTQVFVAGEGDHYRTRLTHTMEVAQLSRDIARTLSLNEDLAECIALAHDLGHPPFAHMGEEALDAWMKKHPSTSLGAGSSSFEHNTQSLRVVTLLEEHSSLYPGLNLNGEIIEGLKKHPSQRSSDDDGPGLEAQIVNLADEIAYSAHDCDDGLRAGLFTIGDLSVIPLIGRGLVLANERGTSLRGALIHLLVTDLYATTVSVLSRENIRTLDDVYGASGSLVYFSPEVTGELKMLSDFLHSNMYSNPRVRDANRQGQEIILALCEKFFAAPTEKILALAKRTGGALPEAVKDYIAGMTDVYARAML